MITAWFRSGPIGRQITALAVAPIIVLALLLVAIQPLAPTTYESTSFAERTAITIETVVDQVRASDAPGQVAAILDAVSKTGLPVEVVSAAELDGTPQDVVADGDVRNLARGLLPDSLHSVLRDRTRDGALSNVLVAQVNNDTALAFAPALGGPAPLFSDKQLNFMQKALVAILLVMLSSYYAGCLITGPLTRFADAAQSIDRDEGQARPFEEGGSREMRVLATSLNDMRDRLRRMINDRTHMLRAISHDLRTPLTRLRLRAERSVQPDLRIAMLKDIERINDMIEETLTYLSKNVNAEAPVKADLPSLVETVCADFADIGFAVTYEGPGRFAYLCKPRALTRAITNLIDNGTKFAGAVVVRLVVHSDGSVQIFVADDGPGISANLREKVLEPFFKASSARPANGPGGFGLGLSIVNDIVRSHGGSMQLLAGTPSGLTVRIDLPATIDSTATRVELRKTGSQQPLPKFEPVVLWPFAPEYSTASKAATKVLIASNIS
ncbi:HAMP domain-containing sensor histidine kinase [Mesorhizobium sp. STM 4661]|uniref:sensor histidine kinase n=1 Tax=Mesorhizobium sp. STM 4661 TaxID=1297570 RepID=UPI0002C03F27|nr:HAMP domain-containing sensor histidine kinase [Mesorhizobium sp. STM 4661]CCV15321.1 putative Sensor protein [Mesorhizobium sp. STM 4661]